LAWHQNYVRKKRAKNVDEIDVRAKGNPVGSLIDYNHNKIEADCVYLSKDRRTWHDTSCTTLLIKALCQRGKLTIISCTK